MQRLGALIKSAHVQRDVSPSDSLLARQVNTSTTLINVQEDDTFTPCLYHEERRDDSRLVRRAPPRVASQPLWSVSIGVRSKYRLPVFPGVRTCSYEVQ